MGNYAVYTQRSEFVAAGIAAEPRFVDRMIVAAGEVLLQIGAKFFGISSVAGLTFIAAGSYSRYAP